MLLSMFHLSNVLTFNLGLFISYCKVHLLLPKRHVQILRFVLHCCYIYNNRFIVKKIMLIYICFFTTDNDCNIRGNAIYLI